MEKKNLLVLLVLISFVELSHEGPGGFYSFNETPKGHKCANSNECDGARTCSLFGWCQGVAKPPKNVFYSYPDGKYGAKCPGNSNNPNYSLRDFYCDGIAQCLVQQNICNMQLPRAYKNPFYKYDEKQTSIRCPNDATDQYYAVRDWYCDGQRTCSLYGWCQGDLHKPKSATYYYDESKTGSRCSMSDSIKDYYCDGNRVCSSKGCTGIARPPKNSSYRYTEAAARCPADAFD